MNQSVIVIFMIIWVGLSAGSILLFQRGDNASLKEKWWPRYTIFSNAIIVGFLVYLQPPLFILLPLLALMIPLTWMTINSTRFCHHCGKVTRNPFFMKRATQCSHCQKSFS